MASFTIGNAILWLKSDESGLKKGLASAARLAAKGAKKIGSSLVNMTKMIAKAGIAAGVAIAAAVAGAVKVWADYGDTLDKMSKRTGIAVETLGEMSHVLDLGGTNLKSFETGIKKMQRTITEAQDGMKEYADAIEAVGVNIEDLEGLSPEEQFFLLAESLADVEDATKKAALAQEIFGRAGTEILPILADGAEGLRKAREEAHELGIVMSKESTDAAAALTDSFARMRSAIKGVMLSVAETAQLHFKAFADRGKEAFISLRLFIEDNRVRLQGIISQIIGIARAIATAIMPRFGDWKAVANSVLTFIQEKLTALQEWMTSSGPAAFNAIKTVAQTLWKTLAPLIKGIASWVIENPKLSAQLAVRGALAIGIVNIAMLLGPIGIAIAGIIAGFSAFAEMWNTGDFTTNWIVRMIDKVDFLRNSIDKLFDVIVAIQEKFTQGSTFDKIKAFVSPGLAIAGAIKEQFAEGGTSRGGLALVGEKGPELISLPAGAEVFTAAESRNMTGGVTVQINSLAVRETADIERISELLFKKVERSMLARGARAV